MPSEPKDRWYPLAASADVAGTHIFQAQIMDNEIAIWRDVEGTAHAWDNRCPHRGTRFTVAKHLGDALACRYHGWRFGTGGACNYIPAHPAQRPSLVHAARTYLATEAHGFIWVSLGRPQQPPAQPDLGSDAWVMRSCAVGADAQRVEAALAAWQAERKVILWIVPASGNKSVVQGVFDAGAQHGPRAHILRELDAELCRVRDALEAESPASR